MIAHYKCLYAPFDIPAQHTLRASGAGGLRHTLIDTHSPVEQFGQHHGTALHIHNHELVEVPRRRSVKLRVQRQAFLRLLPAASQDRLAHPSSPRHGATDRAEPPPVGSVASVQLAVKDVVEDGHLGGGTLSAVVEDEVDAAVRFGGREPPLDVLGIDVGKEQARNGRPGAAAAAAEDAVLDL